MPNPRSEVSYENEIFKAHPIIVLCCVTMNLERKAASKFVHTDALFGKES